jgi:hypothetical protein
VYVSVGDDNCWLLSVVLRLRTGLEGFVTGR